MGININRVTVVGHLTRDPELRSLPGGRNVCSLRLAVNDSVKDPDTGAWRDRPNYFDVDIFGSHGESCAKWLGKGRQVAIDGRLRWHEWATPDGQKRSAVSIVAGNVQFIGQRDGAAGEGLHAPEAPNGGSRDLPMEADPDDDIPF